MNESRPVETKLSTMNGAAECWCGGRLQDSVHPRYARCENCGTLVLRDQPTAEQLRCFYTFDTYWHNHVVNVSRHPPIEQRAGDDLNDRIPVWYELLKRYKPNAESLLEIGCAHGAFLYYCRQRGLENVVGVEPDERTCEYARQRFGLGYVVAGLFPDVHLPFEKFDVVAGFDVIEHFPDPLAAMQRVADLLTDEGIYLFQVPCYRGQGDNWIQFRPEEHLFLYNTRSIHRLFDCAGLDVIETLPGYFPDDIFVVGRKRSVRNILFVRTDSIGDNVLAASMLPHIRSRFKDARITVLCQDHIAELYQPCPFVDDVVSFNKNRACEDNEYRCSIVNHLRALKPDLSLNSVFSREPITDIFTLESGARQRIAFEGNLTNISAGLRDRHNQFYTRLLSGDGDRKPELDRHKDFLRDLGIEVSSLKPIIWTTPEDEEFAERFFRDSGLDPQSTVALFAGAQVNIRLYEGYGQALSQFCKGHHLKVVALGAEGERDINQRNLNAVGVETINLSGRTTIRQSAAIVKRCRLAVGAETGLAHIACAVGTPNVILLGGGHFGRFMPYSPLTSIVCLPLNCFGCDWKCGYERPYCIRDVAPEIITEALRYTFERPCEKIRVFVQSSSRWHPQKGRPRWQMPQELLNGSDVEVISVGKTPDENRRGNYYVTAIVSTYNSERFIRGCLEDLERQTIADRLEIIIVNSGSQQNEEAVVREFQRKYDNIKYVKTDRRESIYKAWNRAIEVASGKYITNANTDDRHAPEAFERLASELDRNPDVAAVYSQFYITTVENQTWQTNTSHRPASWVVPYSRQRLLEKYILGPQPMWRKSLHDEYGCFDDSFEVCGDYEFFLRVSQTQDLLFVPEPLGLYYYCPDSLERRAGTRQTEDRRIWSLYRDNSNEIIRRPFRPDDPDERGITPREKSGDALVTVITVNHNTPDFTKLCIDRVFELSDLPFEMIVVDNGSTDESLDYLRSQERIRLIQLPQNIGHGPALDYAMGHVKTEYVVVIDSDAHPIHDKWLSRLIEPLSDDVLASGIYHHRDYVHPACMAIKAETFRKFNLTFRPNWPPDNDIAKLGLTHWDVGEYISMQILRHGGKLHYFLRSNRPAVSVVGSEYGGIVYHHFYGTRVVFQPNRPEFDGISRHDIIAARDQHIGLPCSERSPLVSVVLPTYNRLQFLLKVLEGFASQTVSGDSFEVIVVDDGSVHPVREVVETFRDRINVVCLCQDNNGPAVARNSGIKAARGDIVLFSDDDDVPAPELIAEHLRSHREYPDEHVAVLGHLDWHPDLEVTPLMHYVTHEGGQYFGFDHLQDGRFYDVWKWWVGLISAKTSLLRSVEGPFDNRLHFGYEDTELACRLLHRNVKILYNAEAKRYILKDVDFEGFCRRRYVQGRALYKVASLHPEVIIPRYGLANAPDLYQAEYEPFLERWVKKIGKCEPMLDERLRRQGGDRQKLLQSLYEVYQKCFTGYWLKGYVEEMQKAPSLIEEYDIRPHSDSPGGAVPSETLSAGRSAGSDYNQPAPCRIAEPVRIVFISTNTPGFDIASSNLRIFHIVKMLAEAGCRIDYLYFNEYADDQKYKDAFDGKVNFVRLPATMSSVTDYLGSRRQEGIDYLWVTNIWSIEFADFALRFSECIKAGNLGAKIIIDTMDFHYKKLARRFNISRDDNDRLMAEQFLNIEKKLYPLSDMVLTVTDAEKNDILTRIGSNCEIEVVPNIHRVLSSVPGFDLRRHICFLGSFHVRHNVDAVDWFLREVWPLVLKGCPDVEFHIIGYDNDRLKDRIEANPNAKLTGYVEDAEIAVAAYRVFVCPMVYGAGLKGKLGVAAATGTPIVTTTVGAEGFDFVDGRDCFIADDPKQFADRCRRLLTEPGLWRDFSTGAKIMVAERFSIRTVSGKLYSLLRPHISPAAAQQPAVTGLDETAENPHRCAIISEEKQLNTSCRKSIECLNLAKACIRQNDPDRALTAYTEAQSLLTDALRIDPDSELIRRLLRSCELARVRYEPALRRGTVRSADSQVELVSVDNTT